MHFKISTRARGVALNEKSTPLAFTVQGDPSIHVSLLPDGGDTNCEAVAECEPPTKVTEALKLLAAGFLPQGSLPRDQWFREFGFIAEDGRISAGHMVPLKLLPQHVQQFLKTMNSDLTEAIYRTVGAVRWRLGGEGPHAPWSSGARHFSFDDQAWHSWPTDVTAYLHTSALLWIRPDVAETVQQLLDARDDEPLAHILWREAYEQRHTNPRSSLLIGVAALEVGVKHFVATVAPDAGWLVENLPSPPIEKILTEYLPRLTASRERQIAGFDKKLIEALRVAIGLRNQVTHRGGAESNLSYERMEITLAAIREVLWHLDEATGHEWAKDLRGRHPWPPSF